MNTSENQNLIKRPPIVVVMGHVDHGKTTLLDYIRKANVASKEAGGITQSVGAYEIEIPRQARDDSSSGSARITFIDTPGHQAFTKMRSRGANIADIAILVVAADDGVNAQTKEAIKIIQEAKIPFVVAINKIDKNNADIEKTKSDLAKNSILLEGYGGSISFQPISAKNGDGIDELLDLILLTADVEEFKFDPKGLVEGFILETHINPLSGTSATAIIKNGTLYQGDDIFSDNAKGRVKGLKNFLNKPVKSLTASAPAVILGFESLPEAGAKFHTNKENYQEKIVEKDNKRKELNADENKINFIIKAVDAGSLEAAVDSIKSLTPPDGHIITILESGVGDISEGDAKLAVPTNAFLIGFKVKVSASAKNLVRSYELKVFSSDIIYKLLDEIKEEFSGQKKQMIAGQLEILVVFDQSNPGAQIIGGKIIAGVLKKQASAEVHRYGKEVGVGKITNLQQDKKEVAEVIEGNECGILFSSQTLVKKGDHLIVRPE
jgi:translation initiation factor IF-2